MALTTRRPMTTAAAETGPHAPKPTSSATSNTSSHLTVPSNDPDDSSSTLGSTEPTAHSSPPASVSGFDSSRSVHKAVTPLPFLKVIVISSVLFCNSFNTTVLIPFVPFMVEDWGIGNRDEVGKYSGFILASYMFGQMIFSYPIGLAADIVGRKPALLIGLMGSCVFTFLFGFAPGFYWALVFRFICGSLNGIVSITKTTLSEITDSTNQGMAFSILGLARAVGLVVGPAVGGFLSQPAKKYPIFFPPGSIFDSYPYALPCLFGSAVSGLGFLASVFILEETMKFDDGKGTTNILETMRTWLSWRSGSDRSDTEAGVSADRNGESEPLLGDYSSHLQPDDASNGHNRRPTGDTVSEVSVTATIPKDKRMSVWDMLNDPKIFLTMMLYTAISALYIQYDEIFSLWSRTSWEEGGLSFDTSNIGVVFSVGGVALFVYQIFMYAPIERALGPLKTFKWGIIFSLPAFVILPNTGLLHTPSEASASWLIWGIVFVCQCLRTCAGLQAFTSSFIMTANSTPAHSRGSANGLSQSFGAFSRMVGPVFAGNVFSWSVSTKLPNPLDFHLIFYILALSTVGIYAVANMVPRDVDYRIEESMELQEEDDEA
ncbi:major facilitator superfamily domain-containing protein [Zopfochytrium polystomum]|nr:major facilitator superfamily domain-containing protein [Zopfochytrium polystomum]